jgi:hypothetical protein
MKTKILITVLHLLLLTKIYAQKEIHNHKLLEAGFIIGGSETLYYGAFIKYNIPLPQNRTFFYITPSLTAYFDFKGESTSDAYLKNDVDMRIIPTINPGYSLNLGKFQLNLEIPLGASIAITKGTLVNERIGFQQSYSNTEVFFNYGFLFAPKFRLNQNNQIGLSAFLPLVKDKAQSGYQFGFGWTRYFGKN